MLAEVVGKRSAECSGRRRRRSTPSVRARVSRLLALGLAAGLTLSASAQETATMRGGGGGKTVIDTSAREKPPTEAPRYETLARGLLGRQVFAAADAKGEYTVEQWGLLVPPGTESEPHDFAGAVVLLVSSGRCAVVESGKEARELTLGSAILIPEGQAFRFVNRDPDRPASLRATVVRGNL